VSLRRAALKEDSTPERTTNQQYSDLQQTTRGC
jgi:hypothetical protein